MTANITVPAGETVNLCLNGNTLNMGSRSITNNGTLTICDCGEGGKITTTTNWDGVVTNYDIFYLTGGTLEDTKTYGLFNEGTATISGGALYGKASGIRNRTNGNLTIKGGDIICSGTGSALQTESEKDMVISGGKFSGNYALSTNTGGTGNIYISGGSFEGTSSGINLKGTGTVYVSGGIITGRYGIYNYSTGNVNVSGGTVTATGSWGIYNYKTAKITVSGGNITSQEIGILNSGDGSVEMTGGTVTGTNETGIFNEGAGSISVSGGTIISKTYGISAYGAGSVFFDGAQINSEGTGISVYKGSLTVASGTITGTGSNGITISAPGTVTVYGGTITGKTYGIENKGTLYLSGSPSISRTSTGNGDILHEKATIYAEDQNGVKYAGEALDIRVFYPSEGKEVILKVDDSNKDRFVLVNTSGGYVLKQSGENLVLGLPHTHSWSTEWSSDGDYHWHECTADDCDVTVNSQKDGYGSHELNDDGNCLTAVICSECGYEATPAKTEHSFTDRASGMLCSEANCQNRAKYYVQCDNCDVVSDTLTVEVGELGYHNWDTRWSKDGDNHWHKCLVVGCTAIAGKDGHFSTGDNVATYTEKAICDECGTEYGDVVPDDVNPTGSITVYDSTWREFLNAITFGIFFKDTQTVDITTSDIGLGVDKAEYIFTETVYDDADAVLNDTGITWKALTLDADGNANFNIVPNEKGIVYLKITDKSGNVTVIRSDKVTIDNIAPTITGIENGGIYCGAVEVTVSDENFDEITVNGIPVTPSDGKIVIEPADYFQTVKATDKAGNETVVEITVNEEHELSYEKVGAATVTETCGNCEHTAKVTMLIDGSEPEKDWLICIYSGNTVPVELNYEGSFIGKCEIAVGKMTDGVMPGIASIPADAGSYHVYLTVDNVTRANVDILLLPATIETPTISSKPYTGETLTADIQDTDLYTVTKNDGGINVGTYEVVLTLKDIGNYEWEGQSGESVTLKFEITKATNGWTDEPSITGWTYGDAVNKPKATAKFGTVQYTFCDAEGNELEGEPKNAGDYIVKVFVPGTDNYTELAAELPFTVGKRELVVKWDAPDYLMYDGKAKTPYAICAGGALDNDTPEISIALTEGCDNVNVGTFTFTAVGVDNSNYVLGGDLVSLEYTVAARPLQQSDFTASIDGLVYTGSAITPALESINTVVTGDDYTVEYENNIKAGENTAKIIITGKRNATGIVEIPFSIAKAEYPNIVWPQNLVGNHGDKLSTVPLLEGFAWKNPDEVIKYGNGNEYAVIYTPEDTDNYKVTEGVATVNGADVTAPTGTVTIGENSWNTLLNNITFGLFFKETQTVTVTAADNESGISVTEYYLATDEISDFADVQWTEFDGSFNINPNNKYVVYIRITNGAGYQTIINSQGVVLDSVAPVISGIENGKNVYGDATFTVDEENLASVTVDGEDVDAVDGKYTIIADDREHTVAATDKSGNTIEYKITVYKPYTVTYDLQGHGSDVNSESVLHGATATRPTDPTAIGYIFGGWYTEADCENAWDFDIDTVRSDMTLYAKWSVCDHTASTEKPTCTGTAICSACGDTIAATGHGETEIRNAKEASCTADGYTGDTYCKVCGDKLEDGTAIAKTAHTYENGKCTVCNAADPNYEPDTPDSPQTGDNSMLWLWIALMVVSGGAALTIFSRGKKRRSGI